MSGRSYLRLDSLEARAQFAVLDDDELRTFLDLATYADRRGVCFPGARRIAEETGLTIDVVYSALEGLEKKGFTVCLLRDAHNPITRKQMPNTYALNPALILVCEEVPQAVFAELTDLSGKPDRKREKNFRRSTVRSTIQIQNPDSELESELDSELNAESKPRASAQSPFTEKAKTENGEKTVSDYAKREPKTEPQRGAAAAGGAAAGRREPKTLGKYKLPLVDSALESKAFDLVHAAADLSLPNARMLVDCYGVTIVNRALAELFERGDAPIYSPARWIRRVIRRLDIEAGENTP